MEKLIFNPKSAHKFFVIENVLEQNSTKDGKR